MNCSHEKLLTYDLTDDDYADFSQRLEEYIKNKVGSTNEQAMTFLTPDVRGANRTKSMRSTTKTSQPSSEDKLSGGKGMNFLN